MMREHREERENGVTIRELHSIGEMALCEGLEAEVWGLAPRDVVPASQLVAAAHAGGLVAAAFDGERAVGFVYGFPSFRPQWPGPGQHSHMLAVLPDYRGRGLGQRLKRFQRDWCLAQGVLWMTWTFDPLQRKNARLNLVHLGAEACEYRVNEYGTMNDRLNSGLPSDRLLAFWDLRRTPGTRDLPAPGALPVALGALEDDWPAKAELELDAAWVAVYSPDLPALQSRGGTELALAWRLAQREVMLHYLGRGYRVSGHDNDAYLLYSGQAAG